jgi:hypothetical protein
MPSNVLVSGFIEPYTSYNGLYLYSGIESGKPLYRLEGSVGDGEAIRWIPDFSVWFIENADAGALAAQSTEPLIPFLPPWESPQWFDLFFEVLNLSVIEVPTDPVSLRNDKYATATESGANRFRRLNSLGYV